MHVYILGVSGWKSLFLSAHPLIISSLFCWEVVSPPLPLAIRVSPQALEGEKNLLLSLNPGLLSF